MSPENEVEGHTDRETAAIATRKDHLCNTGGIDEEMVWESQQICEGWEGVVDRANEERGFDGVYILGQLYHISSNDSVNQDGVGQKCSSSLWTTVWMSLSHCSGTGMTHIRCRNWLSSREFATRLALRMGRCRSLSRWLCRVIFNFTTAKWASSWCWEE